MSYYCRFITCINFGLKYSNNKKMSTLGNDFHWNVFNLCCEPVSSYSIMILNTGLKETEDNSHVANLWRKAAVRICVDGGTNQFYTCIQKRMKRNMFNGDYIEDRMDGDHGDIRWKEEDRLTLCDIPLPDMITGDFDSIDPDILHYYTKLGVRIVPTVDQNKTDFTKALFVLKEHSFKNNIKISYTLVVAGINTHRFDHALAHISTLMKIRSVLPFPVIMICGESLIWLINAGSHVIQVPPHIFRDEEFSWCGYAAFSEKVLVSTTGLKWNLENKLVGFDDLISTSNTYSADFDGQVTIHCSGPLLWFMGWRPKIL